MIKDSGRYKIYIDISGTLKKSNDDVYVGCILVNDLFKSAFREKFYRDFPSLKSFKNKGHSLNPDKLKKVIEFMDSNKIKMSALVLKRHIINRTLNQIKLKIKEVKHLNGEIHVKDFEEKLMGLAYFYAIKKHIFENFHYDCYFCIESQYQIQECFVALSRISHIKSVHIRPSCTSRRVEHMLKFADFVASAAHKVDKFILDSFKNLRYSSYEPSEEDLDVVFNLSRREKSTIIK